MNENIISCEFSEEDLAMKVRVMNFLRKHKILRTDVIDRRYEKSLLPNEEELAIWCVDASHRRDSPYDLMIREFRHESFDLYKLSHGESGELKSGLSFGSIQGISPGNHAFVILPNGNDYRPEWVGSNYIYSRLMRNMAFKVKQKANIAFWYTVVWMCLLKLFYAKHGHGFVNVEDYQSHECTHEELTGLVTETIRTYRDRPKDDDNIVRQFIAWLELRNRGDSISAKKVLKTVDDEFSNIPDKIRAVMDVLVDADCARKNENTDRMNGKKQIIWRQTLWSALVMRNNNTLLTHLAPLDDEGEVQPESITCILDELYENEIPSQGKRWEEM